MAGSPKITEYIGRIAPKDKVGLYMGFSYIPMAIGNLLAGFISGFVYQRMADKITLAQKEVQNIGLNIPEISKNFTKNDYLASLAEKLNLTQQELTNHLWETYHPNKIWIVLFCVGMFAVFMLFLYDRFLIRKTK